MPPWYIPDENDHFQTGYDHSNDEAEAHHGVLKKVNIMILANTLSCIHSIYFFNYFLFTSLLIQYLAFILAMVIFIALNHVDVLHFPIDKNNNAPLFVLWV